MRPLVPVLFASILLLTPLGARPADLLVWWEKGYYAQEDEAVRDIIGAFQQKPVTRSSSSSRRRKIS